MPIISQAQSYSEDFEGTETDWYEYQANTTVTLETNTTDETGSSYQGSESLHAGISDNGACGVVGIAKDFQMASKPDYLTLWVKARSDNWGSTAILIKDADSSTHDVLWDRIADGTSYNTNWMKKQFDISNFSDTFTLIIGNNDDNLTYCGNYNHGWDIWADDIKMFTNNALRYNGGTTDNNYVITSNLVGSGEQALTLEAWVNGTNIPNRGEILTLGDHIAIRGHNWDGKVHAFFYDGSNWPSTDAGLAIDDGKWHHLAFVYDNNNNRQILYVDGKARDTTSHTGSIEWSGLGDWLVIGNHGDGNQFPWQGKIDDVRVWTEAKSAEEIRRNMCQTLKGDEANLEAYYPLNQVSDTTAPDQSANNYDATLNNMSTPEDWQRSRAFTSWIGGDDSDWTNWKNWSNGLPAHTEIDHLGIYKTDGFNQPNVNSAINPTIFVLGTSSFPTINADISVDSLVHIDTVLNLGGNTLTLDKETAFFPKGGASNQYVEGKVSKVGNDAFSFPVGDNGHWARLAISAPSNTTDQFTAAYHNSAYSNTSSTTSNLANVSAVEYWTLSRNNGSSNVDATLFWEDGSSDMSNIEDLTDLKVAHWNSTNSEWESYGNDNTTGDATSGSITVNSVSNFSPFTFGSGSSSSNPLPVELLSFKTQLSDDQDQVKLNWVTASETNNSHFMVQKRNSEAWVNIGKVEGHGNTTEKHYYQFFDPDFQSGSTHYYRLKQVDWGGDFEYSTIETVNQDEQQKFKLTIAPNPVHDFLRFSFNNESTDRTYDLSLINGLGKTVYQKSIKAKRGTNSYQYPTSDLNPGQYLLILSNGQNRFQKRFIKKE